MISSFEKGALNDACLELARVVCANGENGSADIVETVAERFQEEALFHLDYLLVREHDPNILTRAVRYIAEAHATPPMGTDVMWFRHMLSCIVELACPNTVVSRRAAVLFADLESGIAQAKKLS